MKPLILSQYTATTCVGRGLASTLAAMERGTSGLKPCDFDMVDLDTCIGEVDGVDNIAIRDDLRVFDCRNNRLLQMALEEDGFADAVRAAALRYGTERVGVFIGTSTSGILQTELAYRRRNPETGCLPDDFQYAATHNTYSAADFVHRYFGLTGPAAAISSACSSSAKVFASAARMIDVGLIDAAIVGGVDTLCLTTLYGFHSLGLTSSRPCRPFDFGRDGISIGEAAAMALLERVPEAGAEDRVLLVGIGESSDAYHMSSPHPEGLGARMAMTEALQSAQLAADQIGYVNLHGTGTPANDAAEGKAVLELFGNAVPCSSTKGMTGHTLGAAGAVEAIICTLALRDSILPAGLHLERIDPALPLNYLRQSRQTSIRYALSNSFGFGGTNCSLIFGRAN